MQMIVRQIAKDMCLQGPNVRGALLVSLVALRQEQVVPRAIIAHKTTAVWLCENRYNLYVHRQWRSVPDCGRGYIILLNVARYCMVFLCGCLTGHATQCLMGAQQNVQLVCGI